ncbi:MAG: hypothetical protein ACK49G_02330, partial [Brevundimonas sp.]|uniref:hypothetical protein n=1 Tax=Brevundimonas sp. TaxID=1871086 RepID=UPI003918BE67
MPASITAGVRGAARGLTGSTASRRRPPLDAGSASWPVLPAGCNGRPPRIGGLPSEFLPAVFAGGRLGLEGGTAVAGRSQLG